MNILQIFLVRYNIFNLNVPTLGDTSVVSRRNKASQNRTIVIVLSAAVAFGSTEAFTETTFASTWVVTVSTAVELLPNS